MNVNPRTPYRDALTFLRLVAFVYRGITQTSLEKGYKAIPSGLN